MSLFDWAERNEDRIMTLLCLMVIIALGILATVTCLVSAGSMLYWAWYEVWS